MTTQGEQRMLIDGELVEADSGRRFDNINPATEEVLGQVPDGAIRGNGPGHRRGPTGLRRDGLGDEPRFPAALSRTAPGRHRVGARRVA